MANEQMREFWDVQGAEWVRHHEMFDRLLAPFGKAVVAALAPTPGESVLDVGCRFGVMFFEDPQAAFANIGAATRPGGRLAFVCWRTMAENPMFTFGLPRLV